MVLHLPSREGRRTSYLLCACQVYQGVQRMQPVLADRALWQASDVEERETGHGLIGMEQGALLQADLIRCTHKRTAATGPHLSAVLG